ncbi:heme NO-binding domain-containing protein [Catenovulum sp. SM1970]|uniref:heme NO-binding domain-containing protein n=1 Tax=Marinifaba aquimaris TaxID=2741323 RepID=UPI0015719CC5|nr:heme NO-binding domain-containing protein [Marinifaba aquimaris]NTS76654.1 heme NO-binding domain-containing protein [Marinifaba aquimaris]
MKGHIFNLLEDFISQVSDEDTLYEILDQCSFDTSSSFVRTENYPDEHLLEIVNHTIAKLGITMETAQFEFGKWLYPKLIKLLPSEFTDFPHPAHVLKNLDELHKVELTKLYPDAKPPTFQYEVVNETQACLYYCSPRRMFDLVNGVLQGMAEHYDVGIQTKVIANWQGDENRARFELTYNQAPH